MEYLGFSYISAERQNEQVWSKMDTLSDKCSEQRSYSDRSANYWKKPNWGTQQHYQGTTTHCQWKPRRMRKNVAPTAIDCICNNQENQIKMKWIHPISEERIQLVGSSTGHTNKSPSHALQNQKYEKPWNSQKTILPEKRRRCTDRPWKHLSHISQPITTANFPT